MSTVALTNLACQLAEGPLWHTDLELVLFTDIDGQRYHSFDPRTSEVATLVSGHSIGGATIQADGSLLLFMERGAIGHYRNGELKLIRDQVDSEIHTRFNDVAADPRGRVFCGTMATSVDQGRLFRLNLDGTLTVILEGVGCSNGIGFSPDQKTMYYIDTSTGGVDAFDYDIETGEVENRRVLNHHPGPGSPDGMTVDRQGNLWVALWGGSSLLKLSPTGKLVETMAIQAQKVTCPTFGGPNFDQLFVTTAGGQNKAMEGPDAGELLRIKGVGVGIPEFRSRIQL